MMDSLSYPDITLAQFMSRVGLTKSIGEGRRLIKQGAIRINGTKVTEEDTLLYPTFEGLLISRKKVIEILKYLSEKYGEKADSRQRDQI